jgi:hypothetical protein
VPSMDGGRAWRKLKNDAANLYSNRHTPHLTQRRLCGTKFKSPQGRVQHELVSHARRVPPFPSPSSASTRNIWVETRTDEPATLKASLEWSEKSRSARVLSSLEWPTSHDLPESYPLLVADKSRSARVLSSLPRLGLVTMDWRGSSCRCRVRWWRRCTMCSVQGPPVGQD